MIRFRWFLFSVLILPACAMAQAYKTGTYTEKAGKHYEAGLALVKSQHYREAQDEFTLSLSNDIQFIESYRERASVKIILGDNEGAQTDYSLYLEFNPDKKEIVFDRGRLRYEMGRYTAAQEDFLKLLGWSAEDETSVLYFSLDAEGFTKGVFTAQTSMTAIACDFLGRIRYELKDYAGSLVYFDSAITLSPQPDYFVNRALTYEGIKDFQMATKDYNKALVLDPSHEQARYNLAVLAAANGNSKLSEENFADAIRTNPHEFRNYSERAYHRMQRGDLIKALNDYDSAVALGPNHSENWTNRGLLKVRMGLLQSAVGDFSRAINIDASDVVAWQARGNALLKMGQYEKAVEDYSVALFYDNAYSPSYFNRAIARYYLKKNQEACEDLHKAAALGMEISVSISEKICTP